MSSDEETENSYESEEETAPTKGRRTKKGKDPNKPKRNMSAFFLYSNAHRDRIKQQNPDIKFGQIVSNITLFTRLLLAV